LYKNFTRKRNIVECYIQIDILVDLATFSCSPTPLTLTGSENLIITNTTSSCKWKLVFTGNSRVKIQSTVSLLISG